MSGVVIYQRSLDKEIDAIRQEHLQRIAEDILDEAQRAVPVDTGDLRRSGTVRENGDEYEVAFTAPYAAYVELGTQDTPAQPYLLPAAVKRR